ncbi:MAG: hypothetical protein M3Z75_18645 [Actinomycetota bacterium]|nr:hypothetical protein [Actinomycetota bacterium]
MRTVKVAAGVSAVVLEYSCLVDGALSLLCWAVSFRGWLGYAPDSLFGTVMLRSGGAGLESKICWLNGVGLMVGVAGRATGHVGLTGVFLPAVRVTAGYIL